MKPAQPRRGALLLGFLVCSFVLDATAASPGEGRPCTPTLTVPPARIAASGQRAIRPQPGPGFFLADTDAAIAACLPNNLGNQSLVSEAMAQLAALDLDPELAVVLTTQNPGCDRIFYVPVANQTRGIGYGHLGDEVFDNSPDSRLEGVLFLNDFPYWQDHPDEYRTAFLHEIAHRMSGRVFAQRGAETFDLTGREHAHWSYFLDSDSSPLEGNDFSEMIPFTTQTEHHPLTYSALDLYLMGALGAKDVPEFRFFSDAAAQGLDCKGRAVQTSSPPQTCEPREITGTLATLGIDNVIAAEGERSPASDEPERNVVFLIWGNEGFDLKMCSELATAVEQNVSDYREATLAQLTLTNLASDGACDRLEYPPPSPRGCSLAPTTGRATSAWRLLALAGSVFLLGRRTARKVAKGPSGR